MGNKFSVVIIRLLSYILILSYLLLTFFVSCASPGSTLIVEDRHIKDTAITELTQRNNMRKSNDVCFQCLAECYQKREKQISEVCTYNALTGQATTLFNYSDSSNETLTLKVVISIFFGSVYGSWKCFD